MKAFKLNIKRVDGNRAIEPFTAIQLLKKIGYEEVIINKQ